MTISGVTAATAGSYGVITSEVSAAQATMAMTGASATTRSTRPACVVAASRSQVAIVRTRSKRSAITPAYALKTSEGTNRAIPAAPTQPSDPVRS